MLLYKCLSCLARVEPTPWMESISRSCMGLGRWPCFTPTAVFNRTCGKASCACDAKGQTRLLWRADDVNSGGCERLIHTLSGTRRDRTRLSPERTKAVKEGGSVFFPQLAVVDCVFSERSTGSRG